MHERPLVFIPGPVEISPRVLEAAAGPPPAHTAPGFIAAFGRALAAMQQVWQAGPGAQPFVVAGSGSLAMEMAVVNLLDPGMRALVVDTGYFSERMARMLERRGVLVRRVSAEPGEAVEDVALEGEDAVFATHVDTSTGVRQDVERVCRAGREAGALVIVDGVCATGGETFRMGDWGADVYLTASQKALGLPPGLALLVASAQAMEARRRLRVAPPLSLDWIEWEPVMQAYADGRPSYFATPATTLVRALDVGLAEIVEGGVQATWDRHARVAGALRAAWAALGLHLLPAPGVAANTLSALRYPDGVDATLPARIATRGIVVAGGLHPLLRTAYFRVGHMGYATTQPAMLARVVRAVGDALADAGWSADVDGAVRAFEAARADG